MAAPVLCPGCGTRVAMHGAGIPSRCPECDARLRPKKKRKPEPPWYQRPLVLWGGAGTLAAFLLLAGLAVLLLTLGGGNPPGGGPGGGAGAGGGKDDRAAVENPTVVIDAPVPPLPVVAPPPPWGQPPAKEEPRPDPDAPPPPPADWKARPDPPAAPLTAAIPTQQPFDTSLVLPLQDTPFVAYLPRRLAQLPLDGLDPKVEKDLKPVVVVDLRTGKPAGEFPPQAPVWRNGRLSPDGLYAFGPDTAPGNPAGRRDGLVFVWKRGEDRPAAQLALAGLLLWADFVAPDRLATVTAEAKVIETEGTLNLADEKATFRVWDVTTGKAVAETALGPADMATRRLGLGEQLVTVAGGTKNVPALNPDESELLTAVVAKTNPLPKLLYLCRRQLGTVSPGGRYVALAGRDGVTVVATADGKVAGRLPLPPGRGRRDYHGFGFSADGATLYAVVHLVRRDPKVHNPPDDYRLLSWSMADGRQVTSARVPFTYAEVYSRILPGPLPNSVILSRVGEQELPGVGIGLGEFYLSPPLEYSSSAAVVDVESGAKLAPLTFGVQRWVGPGQVLAQGVLHSAPKEIIKAAKVGPGDNFLWNHNMLWVGRLDGEALKELGGAVLAGLPDRPPLAEADRAGVAAVRPAAPAAWAVPPAGPAPPGPAAERLPAWPDAWADNSAALITYTYIEDKDAHGRHVQSSRLRVDWRRLDLRTGKDAGPAVPLWPWASRKGIKGTWWTQPPSPAALTADGSRLAFADPGDAARVDVWGADGKRLAGFRPYGPGGAVAWLGWTGNGRLLTLGKGKLTAWEVPACKAVFEVDGGYDAPAHLPPGRAWVVAATAAHADVIDAATGKVLGRCAGARGEDDWKHTALSPDGKTLLRVRHIAAPKYQYATGAAHLWDLATGEETGPVGFGVGPAKGGHLRDAKFPDEGNPPKGVMWAGNRRFLSVAPQHHLVDLDAGLTAGIYTFPAGYEPINPAQIAFKSSERPALEPLAVDPAGRLWVSVKRPQLNPAGSVERVWRPLPVPDPAGPVDAPLAAADRELPFRPGAKIKVEANLGAAARSRKLATHVAGLLQGEGYQIGPGGWTVRLTFAEAEAAWALEGGPTGRIAVPSVVLTWEALAPDGKAVWQGRVGHGWRAGPGSRYFVGSERKIQPGGAQPLVITNYNFGGRDPRAAILEEILDSPEVTRPADVPVQLPRAVLRAGGRYLPLPLTAEFAVPGP